MAGRRRRRNDATAALAKVRPDVDVEATLDTIEEAARAEDADRATWGEVFARSVRKPLMVAVGLAVAQQITGINAIIYYADTIFAKAGFATPADQAAATTWAIGGGQRAGHLHRRRLRRPLRPAAAAARRPRRHGRQPHHRGHRLPLHGPADTSGPGDRRADHGRRPITLVALVVFIASFAFSPRPGRLDRHQRGLPGRVRGRAVAFATAVNWGAAFLVSEFFLTLLDGSAARPRSGCFAVFAIGVVFVWI